MQETIINNLKKIEICTESGTKYFNEPEEVQKWISVQRELYSFMSSTKNQHSERSLVEIFNQSWKHISNKVQQLLNSRDNPEEYNNVVDGLSRDFNNLLSEKRLYTENAPFSEFVLGINDKTESALVLCYLFDHQISGWNTNVHRAFQKAVDFKKADLGRIECELHALEKMKSDWDKELNAAFSYANELKLKLDQLNSIHEDKISEQENLIKVKIEEHENLINESIAKATTQLDDITKTYDEKLALQASVSYWGQQERHHMEKAGTYAKFSFVAAAFVFILLIIFSYVYLDGILGQIPLSKLIVFAGISTFGIWGVKIVTNIYMSHLHLATDAKERVTMINTYLALLRSNDAPPKEERQLILQTLFRPGTTGLIKDDHGPASFVDLVTKLGNK